MRDNFLAFAVELEQREWGLLQFLLFSLPAMSTKQIKSCIDLGLVQVDQKICKISSSRLQLGQVIKVYLSFFERRKSFIRPMEILIEKEHFLLCNKPIGISSTEENFFRILKQPVYLVHRLDKETSGIILLGKSPIAKEKLEGLFRKRAVTKKYVAIVEGLWQKKEGKLEGFFQKKKQLLGQSIWSGKAEQGLPGITFFQIVQKNLSTTLLLLHPYTGRTHQLRVQLSEAGFPVLGDSQYRGTIISPRMFLHAYELSFQDPFTKEVICHKAPIPKEFKEITGVIDGKNFIC